MTPGAYNLAVVRGDTLRNTLTWKTGSPSASVNLTGYSAKLQARDANGTVVVEALSTGGSPRITLGGAAGTIALHLPASATAIDPGNYAYDLQMTAGSGDVTTLLAGTLEVLAETTT